MIQMIANRSAISGQVLTLNTKGKIGQIETPMQLDHRLIPWGMSYLDQYICVNNNFFTIYEYPWCCDQNINKSPWVNNPKFSSYPPRCGTAASIEAEIALQKELVDARACDMSLRNISHRNAPILMGFSFQMMTSVLEKERDLYFKIIRER